MAKQRIVNDDFWTDPYIENLDPSEKLLFLYLLTNPLCNVAGIYEIRINRIAYDTGFDKEMIEKMLGRFIKDKKIIKTGDWIIIINFIKNQSKNPSVLLGIQRILDSLPPACVQALTASPHPLPYLTLLNLTLPNSTLPNTGDIVADETGRVINQLIEEFKPVNPSYEKFFSNKTQRSALERLLKKYGKDNVVGLIKYLPIINADKYAKGKSITPLQLEDNLAHINNHYKQKTNNKPKIANIPTQ